MIIDWEERMLRNSIGALAFVIAATIVGTSFPLSAAEGPQVKRTVLMQQDLAIPGYSTALVQVDFPVGAREGRHTHPGTVMVHVEEGAVTLFYEGHPMTTYKAGETFFVETGKVHEGINNGNAPAKAIASFVVEKGKPLTTQQ
jgi:quercetin dioxygenase-like cupin family protein